MKMNLMDLINAKLELFRLEQKYTKRRHRRSTFVSDATYVDGEYVYSNSNSNLSSSTSGSSSYSHSSPKKSVLPVVSFRSIVEEEPVQSREERGRTYEREVDAVEERDRKWKDLSKRSWGRKDKRRSVALGRGVAAAVPEREYGIGYEDGMNRAWEEDRM